MMHRGEWYMNYWLVGSLVLGTIWLLYQTFAGSSYFAEDILDLKPLPTYFGFYLVAIYAGTFAASMLLWAISFRLLRIPRLRRKLPILL